MSVKSKQEQGASYFPALTGIRAIAAWMVFVHHFKPFENSKHHLLKALSDEMHVGVTLFFVLSGFLIAYRYMDQARLNFRNYFVKRFAKIFPVFFILTTATVLIYGRQEPPIPFKDILFVWLMNISFLKGFFESLVYTGIAQGWSLTIEECFYLLAPFLFWLIRKNKHSLYLLPVLFLGLGFFIVQLFKGNDVYAFMGSNHFMLNMTFFGRCTEFFIGIGLAMVVKKNLFLKLPPFLTYGGVLLILFCIYGISTFKGEDPSGLYSVQGKLINHLLLPLTGIAALYLGLLREKTRLAKLLSGPLFQALGKSSYVFYLIHMGIFSDLVGLFSHNIIIAFILLNLIAYALYRSLELPLQTWINKRFLKVRSRS